MRPPLDFEVCFTDLASMIHTEILRFFFIAPYGKNDINQYCERSAIFYIRLNFFIFYIADKFSMKK